MLPVKVSGRDPVPVGGCSSACGLCPPCVFAPPSPGRAHTPWSSVDPSTRRFVAALLTRCGDARLLQSIQRALGATQRKLFTYARSRCSTPVKAEPTHPPEGGTPRVDRTEIWTWFDSSPTWVRSSYLCRVLQLCDPELLRMASNLTSVLLIRLKSGFPQRNERIPAHPDEDSEEPALTVVPGSSKSFSGVSRYKDFIGGLPVGLSKRILGLLEDSALISCAMVSSSWRRLAQEVREELEFRRNLQRKIKARMKRKPVPVSPTYAGVVDVPVPKTKDDEEDVDSSRPKVGACASFGAAYRDVETKAVPMEERNVYCGAYFTEVVVDKEDPHRVLDYEGGPLMAVASRDRSLHLLHVASKTEGAVLRGHVGRVRAVLLRQDRDLLITGSSDASIRCWSLKTEKCERVLYAHSGSISCLDVDADTLVSGSRDRFVKVWSLQSGKQVNAVVFKHPSPVLCVKVRGRTVYSSCERGLVKVWGVEEASLLRVIDIHSSVRCLFVDPLHLLCGDSSGTVTAWSELCDTEQSLMTFSHPQEVRSLTLLYLRVVTACADGKIRIFHFLTGDCLKSLTAQKDVSTSRVLSTHFLDDRILVNSTSGVKFYQFADVLWDPECCCEAAVKEVQPTERRAQERRAQERRAQERRAQRTHGCRQRAGSPRAGARRAAASESLVKSERAARERVRRRGPHHPPTRDSMLLALSAIQRGRRTDRVSANTRSNMSLGDSWSRGDRDSAID